VASEAVTAVVMHLTKLNVIVGEGDLYTGALLGAAMIAGSWTGHRLVEKMSETSFHRLIEVL
jgi:hypothetical protein